MKNFDKKIRLGAALVDLKVKRAEFTLYKEKCPSLIYTKDEYLHEIEPLVCSDKETWSAINAACTNILDIYIAAIDRKFAELKAEFEALDKE